MTLEREALDLLREHGFIKDDISDLEGRLCAIGALRMASSGSLYDYGADPLHPYMQTLKAIAKVAQEQYPDRAIGSEDSPLETYRLHTTVSAFNDHPDTTMEDIERVFEKAEISRLDELL